MVTIRYMVCEDDGMCWSQVRGEIAIPILDYEAIGEGGDFTQPLRYSLEKMSSSNLVGQHYTPTRKIPTEIKNLHREFWGMKPLAVSPDLATGGS